MPAWITDARTRVMSIYPNWLWDAARALATTTPDAIQYLEQAPAVVAFILHGGFPKRPLEQRLAASMFKDAIRDRARLKAVLRRFRAPLQIRQIRGYACQPQLFPTIYSLRDVPPSVLAQAVPEKSGAQATWLKALKDVRFFLRTNTRSEFQTLWQWAVPTLGAEASQRASGLLTRWANLRDFIAAAPNGTFNPTWSWAEANTAMQRWHAHLGRQRSEAATLQRMGYAFDHRFPYDPIPDEIEIRGYTFVALRSGEELFLEGAAMRHCVATYIASVATGRTYIIGIRRQGRSIATLQLTKRGSHYAQAQIAGPCNAPVPPAVQAAADEYRLLILKRAQQQQPPRPEDPLQSIRDAVALVATSHRDQEQA